MLPLFAEGNKLGAISPILFIILSICIWVQIAKHSAAQNDLNQNLDQFIGYASKCLVKYDIFSEGVNNVKIDVSSTNTGITFEIIL